MRRLIITALLTAAVITVAACSSGLLSPTAGVSTTVAGVGGPALLIRLELSALAGAPATGVLLVAPADRDPAVDPRAAPGWLVLAVAGFLVGTVVTRQFAPGLVDVLVGWGRVAADP